MVLGQRYHSRDSLDNSAIKIENLLGKIAFNFVPKVADIRDGPIGGPA